MFRIRTGSRLALIVTMIVVGNLWMAYLLRIAPRPDELTARARVEQARSLSVMATQFAESGRLAGLARVLEQICQSNGDVVSAGLRRPTGNYRFTAGDHLSHWKSRPGAPDQLSVSIDANGQRWGDLELRFRKPARGSPLAWLLTYPVGYVLFCGASTCLLAWVMFARIFRYLDPRSVVPGRVRSALDTLAAGLVLIDPCETIVHANEAFGRMMGVDRASLVGTRLDQFSWIDPQNPDMPSLPWSARPGSPPERASRLLELHRGGQICKYMVNTNPIVGENAAASRGALISFDDVTQLEKKKQDLAATIDSLRSSRDEIRKQNDQLRFLAMRDPMTRCFNRRSFWELFDEQWRECPPELLNVLMIDVDHFKSINDNFGHSRGDDVLRETGAMLMHLVGSRGHVCRFGGEEFAVILPRMTLQQAEDVAGMIHAAFQKCQIGGLSVTASLGLSNRQFGAMDSQHLLDQADQSLYAAKRNGRNRVVGFHRIRELTVQGPGQQAVQAVRERVPFTTVTALFSMLSSRDPAQARESLEIADLCVSVGHELLDRQQLYWTESAALLMGCESVVESPDTRKGSPMQDQTGPTSFRRRVLPGDFAGAALGDCEIVTVLRTLEGNRSLRPAKPADGNLQRRLEECVLILAACRAAVWQRRGNVNLPPQPHIEALASGHVDFPVRMARRIEEVLRSGKESREKICPVRPELAMAIERHYAELNLSVGLREKSRFGKAIQRFREEVPEDIDPQFHALFDSVEQVANGRDPDFGKLASLVDQILEISRRSRRARLQEGYQEAAGECDGKTLLLAEAPVAPRGTAPALLSESSLDHAQWETIS